MSLALRPPRTSALGFAWSEDFHRSYQGVVRNGGTITGSIPMSGDWATFGGAQFITYPSLRPGNLTEISFGARVKDTGGAGYQNIITNTDAATSGFYLNTPDGWGNLNGRIFISGTLRVVSAAFPGGDVFLVVTWKTGDYIRLYGNGVLIGTSGATYAGAITESVVSSLLIGAVVGIQMLVGKASAPFVVSRQLSAAEALQMHNNSLCR